MPQKREPLGLYVHIPFCASKCGYCDFYSITGRAGRHAYADILVQEISSYQGQGYTADTLFFGGGTPSLMEAEELVRLLSACREAFSLDMEGEITLEANPDSVSLEYLKTLRKAGFNRVSFGAQSILDGELKALGRRHDASRIRQAMEWAKEPVPDIGRICGHGPGPHFGVPFKDRGGHSLCPAECSAPLPGRGSNR